MNLPNVFEFIKYRLLLSNHPLERPDHNSVNTIETWYTVIQG